MINIAHLCIPCMLDMLILNDKTVHNAHMLSHNYPNTITRVYAN